MAVSAVVQLAGKQFKVAEGDILVVDRLKEEAGKKMTVSDVLLTTDGDTTQVGTPMVKGAKVDFEVVEHTKADKIRVFKYKSKSKYRRTYGHKQPKTTLKVTKISA